MQHTLDHTGLAAPVDTYHQACRLLEHVTYKPGYSFNLLHARAGKEVSSERAMWRFTPDYYLSMSEGPTILQLHANVPDASGRHPGKIDVVSQTMLEPVHFSDGFHFMSWLRIVIGEFEEHERDEWLRIDGQLLIDPHQVDLRTLPGARR
jgi:hypothetical protein